MLLHCIDVYMHGGQLHHRPCSWYRRWGQALSCNHAESRKSHYEIFIRLCLFTNQTMFGGRSATRRFLCNWRVRILPAITLYAGIILGMGSATETRRYILTPPVMNGCILPVQYCLPPGYVQLLTNESHILHSLSITFVCTDGERRIYGHFVDRFHQNIFVCPVPRYQPCTLLFIYSR